ncbi:hypothetical protein HIM_09258 [Hirsutella minnesotensis 3608]|uniref:Secretory phospholipase A2 n=1 Tax=Hirsutella minnesotensis 3608 TaxID=1043627 RepID=A0A0F7ZLR6_9HYPO|nr:hypothetical protein HIM_09258 [Hirsutella minnesotensis 3608]
MKFLFAVAALVSAALAMPAAVAPMAKAKPARSPANPQAIVDELQYSVPLSTFTARRNKRDPPSLDWKSDGCTRVPDNPFGFPFLQACHRHDFGYQNFRIQHRFTKANKLKIDLKFKEDLYHQCGSVFAKTACEKLADVYYAGVRAFGGRDAKAKREDQAELRKAYDDAVIAYNQAVEEAQAEGLLPMLD